MDGDSEVFWMEYIPAKTIVTKVKAPANWFGIDYNMNIYKGCSHGCIYCDSRSDCYGVEHFDKVRAKENALKIIRDDLRRKTRSGVVGTGAMSDPYNPFERELELTRHGLELCDAFEFGAAIATKSSLLERDIDILQGIAEHSPVILKITVTTADDELAAKIEPRISRPTVRSHESYGDILRKSAGKGRFCIVWMILSASIKDLTGWSRCRCSFVRD